MDVLVAGRVRNPRRPDVVRRDRVGLIGPNGSGKTTLLRLLLGEIESNQGSVRTGTNV